MEQPIQTSSLRDLLNVLFKHKHKILITFLATVATVTVGTFLITPIYQTDSTLLVKFGREYTYRPEVGERIAETRSFNQEEAINSEIQILTSNDLIEKVIASLKVENMYPELVKNPSGEVTPPGAATPLFKQGLSVEGIQKSNVIQISFQHKDPVIAAKALNLLVDFLREKHLQVYSDPKSSFLEKQLSTYDQKLKESQNRLEGFKQKYQVYSLEEQRTLLLKQRSDLDTAYKTSQNQIKELQYKLSSLKQQLRSVSETVNLQTETGTEAEQSRIIDDAKTNLLTLQLKEQQLLDKYREDNRLVVSVRKEMKLVQDFINKQEETQKGRVTTTTGKNVVYVDIEKELIKTQAELASQEAKSGALKQQLTQLDSEIQNFNLREKELDNIKRDFAENEKNYKTYQEKAGEARISEDMNRQKMANISVIQAAGIPGKPVKPKKAINIAMGIILGAVAGLGLAFLSEYAGQGVSTPESAERRLGMPVLSTVSYKRL